MGSKISIISSFLTLAVGTEAIQLDFKILSGFMNHSLVPSKNNNSYNQLKSLGDRENRASMTFSSMSFKQQRPELFYNDKKVFPSYSNFSTSGSNSRKAFNLDSNLIQTSGYYSYYRNTISFNSINNDKKSFLMNINKSDPQKNIYNSPILNSNEKKLTRSVKKQSVDEFELSHNLPVDEQTIISDDISSEAQLPSSIPIANENEKVDYKIIDKSNIDENDTENSIKIFPSIFNKSTSEKIHVIPSPENQEPVDPVVSSKMPEAPKAPDDSSNSDPIEPLKETSKKFRSIADIMRESLKELGSSPALKNSVRENTQEEVFFDLGGMGRMKGEEASKLADRMSKLKTEAEAHTYESEDNRHSVMSLTSKESPAKSVTTWQKTRPSTFVFKRKSVSQTDTDLNTAIKNVQLKSVVRKDQPVTNTPAKIIFGIAGTVSDKDTDRINTLMARLKERADTSKDNSNPTAPEAKWNRLQSSKAEDSQNTASNNLNDVSDHTPVPTHTFGLQNTDSDKTISSTTDVTSDEEKEMIEILTPVVSSSSVASKSEKTGNIFESMFTTINKFRQDQESLDSNDDDDWDDNEVLDVTSALQENREESENNLETDKEVLQQKAIRKIKIVSAMPGMTLLDQIQAQRKLDDEIRIDEEKIRCALAAESERKQKQEEARKEQEKKEKEKNHLKLNDSQSVSKTENDAQSLLRNRLARMRSVLCDEDND